jgi:hypothetical protein
VQAPVLGAAIIDVKLHYDKFSLLYVRQQTLNRYIFLISCAAYSPIFKAPVDANSKEVIAINKLQPQNCCGVDKLHAKRHQPVADTAVDCRYKRIQLF